MKNPTFEERKRIMEDVEDSGERMIVKNISTAMAFVKRVDFQKFGSKAAVVAI